MFSLTKYRWAVATGSDKIAVLGAICSCKFGATPCPVSVNDTARVFIGGRPIVRSSDAKNISTLSFGMCFCPLNPKVKKIPPAIIKPTLCQPKIVTPNWITKKMNVKVGKQFPCSTGDICMCMWGGVISISVAGQFNVS